jgi:hypothetical protein
LIQKFFDLQGASLRVTATQPVLVDFFGRIFAGRSRPLPTAPLAYGLTITSGEPLVMPEATEPLYQGPVRDEGGACFWQGPDGPILVFPGLISVTLSATAREATIIVAPGAEERIVMTCGQLALQSALLAARQFLVHAAGLTLPDGRVALIFGRSGAGKTTATLALAAGGLGLCSDDAMACNVSAERPTAWGIPRNLKVRRHTAQMLPWVRPLLSGEWSAEEERPVTLASLRTVVSVEGVAPREIAAIFVLERSGASASLCEPVSKAEVLALAGAENVPFTRLGLPDAERELFERLGGLVRMLPTYRLSAGSGLSDLAPAVLAALGIEKITA